MKIFPIKILFDGGCAPTNPGNKYGSFEVKHLGRTVLRKERFPLGWGTNNEAEFEALETCLKAILSDMEPGGIDPKRHSLEIFTDSMIVQHRMSAAQQDPDRFRDNRTQVMVLRANQCLSLCKQFGLFSVQWHGRENNVAAFGH